MSKSEQWVRFFPNDWLNGTSHLKCLEKGVYITLVALMYDNNGPIENDPKWLAGQCGLTRPAFDRALEKLILVKKITTEDGSRLSNEKCQKTLTFRTEKISIMKRKAMVTNIKKAMKSSGKVVGGRSHSVTHSESHSGAKPEPEYIYSSSRTYSYPPTPRKVAPSLASPFESGSLGAPGEGTLTKVDKGPTEGRKGVDAGKQASDEGVDNSAAAGHKQIFGLVGAESDLALSAAIGECDRSKENSEKPDGAADAIAIPAPGHTTSRPPPGFFAVASNGSDVAMDRKSASLNEALDRLGRGVYGLPERSPPEPKTRNTRFINGISIEDVPDRPTPESSWQKLGEQF
jgi:uncharacterized protein YdaU (DUF1376 family)